MKSKKREFNRSYKNNIYKKILSTTTTTSTKTALSIDKIKNNTELTKAPISGIYILKNWKQKEQHLTSKKKQINNNNNNSNNNKFTKDEVALNAVAASFVSVNEQTRAEMALIVNNIGPYECKLCKVIYIDAFELAMHNCPRILHLDYK